MHTAVADKTEKDCCSENRCFVAGTSSFFCFCSLLSVRLPLAIRGSGTLHIELTKGVQMCRYFCGSKSDEIHRLYTGHLAHSPSPNLMILRGPADCGRILADKVRSFVEQSVGLIPSSD